MTLLLRGIFFTCVAVVGMTGAGVTSAHAITCDVGQYPDAATGDVCTACTNGYWCDGDTKTKCPTPSEDKILQRLASIGIDDVLSMKLDAIWTWTPEGTQYGAYLETQCRVSYRIYTGRGNVLIEPTWNGTDYWWPDGTHLLWYTAANGYYLSGYRNTTYENWYNNIKACTNAPRNAHYTGPGTPDEPKSGGKTDYNDCPWECDAGKLCQTPCSAGFQYLHVSTGVKVKLWNEKLTDRSLVVEYNGRKCYGNLDAGAASGALNVNIGGTTYHLAD